MLKVKELSPVDLTERGEIKKLTIYTLYTPFFAEAFPDYQESLK
jgi:hypothetical protein